MTHPDEIKKLHRTLASLVCKASGKSTVIRSESKRPFSIKIGGRVDFELIYRDRLEAEMAYREMGGKGSSKKVDVFPLLRSEQKPEKSDVRLEYWVSWYEQWIRLRVHDFDLVKASWTLFRGMEGTREKKQILRADWDQIHHVQGSQDAGQPHWHFDYPILATSEYPQVSLVPEGPVMRAIRTSLRGSALIQSQGLIIGHVHLAMGTWNKLEEFPGCWQRGVEKCDDLRVWAEKTLLYLQGQFKNHSLG